jgi:hypothetical protein
VMALLKEILKVALKEFQVYLEWMMEMKWDDMMVLQRDPMLGVLL